MHFGTQKNIFGIIKIFNNFYLYKGKNLWTNFFKKYAFLSSLNWRTYLSDEFRQYISATEAILKNVIPLKRLWSFKMSKDVIPRFIPFALFVFPNHRYVNYQLHLVGNCPS